MRTTRHRIATMTLLSVIAVVPLASACSETAATELAVGDCIDTAQLAEADEVASIPVIDCAEPHDAEIFAELELPEGDFPGSSSITTKAEDFCTEEFETFTGIAMVDSIYYLWPLTPTEDGWAQHDDRKIQCVIDTDGELVTGTLKGAGI